MGRLTAGIVRRHGEPRYVIRTRRERDRAGFEVAPDTVAPLRVDVGKHTRVKPRGHHLVVGRELGEYGILMSLHCHLTFRGRTISQMEPIRRAREDARPGLIGEPPRWCFFPPERLLER